MGESPFTVLKQPFTGTKQIGNDRVTAGEHQEIRVALQLARVGREALAAVVRLLQLVALHHRPHGAVDVEQALVEEGLELFVEGAGHGVWLTLWRLR